MSDVCFVLVSCLYILLLFMVVLLGFLLFLLCPVSVSGFLVLIISTSPGPKNFLSQVFILDIGIFLHVLRGSLSVMSPTTPISFFWGFQSFEI